jgi:phage gpG-like protein
MGMHFEGVDAFKGAIDGLVRLADEGGRKGVTAAALKVASKTKTKLTTSTHKKGTPTPSRAGDPPSLVTGTLRRSVKTTPAVPLGAGAWQASVGPTAVYSRIQELGGECGRGHLTRLPARPYLAPTLKEMIDSGELWSAFREGWA